MLKGMFRGGLAFALLATSSVAWGQDTLLDDLYGRGVHAYFAGRMQEAHS